MKAEETWIIVPRWDDFQHYRDRDPVWIKSYLRLLHDPNYMGLTAMQRGVLHGIWLLYAASNQMLTSVHARGQLVTNRGESSHFARTLKRLNHAGFIELSASKPLAARYQLASPEKETEKEGPPLPPSGGGGNQSESNGNTSKTTSPCANCGKPVERGQPCLDCGASPREAGSSPRAARASRSKKSPFSLAEKMTRNGGWQYEPDAFREELGRYKLTADEQERLAEIRQECALQAGAPAEPPASTATNPFFK